MVKKRSKTKKRTGKHLPKPLGEVKKEVVAEDIREEVQEWHHVATVEELEGLNRKIHITFDTDAVKMAFDKAAASVSKKTSIKGFRRGRAPKALVETYCKEDIEKAASSMLSQEGYLHACYENKFHALNEPKVDDAEFHIDGTFSCDITLEIKPSIAPTGYVGLQLEKETVDRDQIIEAYVTDAKRQHVTEVEADIVALESIVSVTFSVQVGEEVISSGDDHKFEIRAGQEPPFGENLVGRKAGDSLIEKITLPEQLKEHAGVEADVHVAINSIITVTDPTDEEFVERMQAPSLEDLMKVFKERAEQEASKKEQESLKEIIVDKLLDLHAFEVPLSWVDDEEKYMLAQLNMESPDAQILEHIKKMAVRNVKRTFILDAVYDAEPGIRVTQEEFDGLLEKEAELKGVSKLILQKKLREEGMLDAVFGILKHKKVMDMILSQAHITIKGEEVSVEADDTYEIPENPLG